MLGIWTCDKLRYGAAEDLVDVGVDATLVGGELVYEREREEGR